MSINPKHSGLPRRVVFTTRGVPASDGAGVRLRRIIGTPELEMADPFLLFDNFESDNPDDYVGGFPDHPHRGFETVTYLVAGHMRHRDSTGREGVIEPGGVQWMTAGRGIVHSEMPEQENGLLSGFQLWVNLPASLKMAEPAYREFAPGDIPEAELPGGGTVRAIAGKLHSGVIGPVTGVATEPVYLDVTLPKGATFAQFVPATHGAFLHVIEGSIAVGEVGDLVDRRTLAVLGDGDRVAVTGMAASSRFLLAAGRALNEPVARGGPFVMNTRAEVLQAFDDYQNGRF
jgi:redox-sensitive bicupin YhaK (pirin superfamily)